MVGASLVDPGRIGFLELPNRLIRSGTSESMGRPDGTVGEDFADLHRSLARGGVGLAFTGHLYVSPRGRYDPIQVGIHTDATIAGLRAATAAVHREEGRIFAQLGHAGSQSVVTGLCPVAPSDVPNVMHGRHVRGASPEDVEQVVAAFGAAARRAAEAGFDGVHLHGANGYLISQFRSPLTNQREDEWGGADGREALPVAIIRTIREALPRHMPLTMKIGVRDIVDAPGGLTQEQSIIGISRLVDAGLDAIEVSSNLMSDYVSGSIRPYVAVDRQRAMEDLLLHRLHKSAEPEAYFLPDAIAVRQEIDIPIILVGGLRRRATIERVLASGQADFVSMARPFIREPDLARRLADGAELPACVSCNICLMHDGHHALRCWRIPRRRLLHHAILRMGGHLRH
ncbi:MAG: NADH:flavin oxidoreductase [Actinomycetota bacterium]|nr:NADH:flavin oxidoreductase [Actinomycetota bacterium]